MIVHNYEALDVDSKAWVRDKNHATDETFTHGNNEHQIDNYVKVTRPRKPKSLVGDLYTW